MVKDRNEDKLIRRIKKHENYRAQLMPYFYGEAEQARKVSIQNKEFISILDELDINIFDFQGEALKSFIDGNNLFIVGGYGSGRSTTGDILSIYTLLEGKSSLYLLPNSAILEERFKVLEKRIGKIRTLNNISIDYAKTSVELSDKIKSEFPEIIITSAESLYTLLTNKHPEKFIRNYLYTLGMISFERMEEFRPNEIIFLSRLISLLNELSSARFVITSSAIGDYPSLRDIAKNPFKLIKNTKLQNNIELYVWIAPFKVELLEDQETFEFTRVHYVDEASNLIGILQELNQRKILLWKARSNLVGELNLDFPDLTIIDDIADTQLEKKGEFDAIIIIGMPYDFKNLTLNINNFVKNNGKVFIIPADDLLSYFLLWTEYERVKELPDRKYFYSFIESDPFKEKFRNLMNSIAGSRVKVSPIPHWGVLSDNLIKVRYPSGKIIYIDKNLLPYYYYEGKILFEREKGYKVSINEGQYGIYINLLSQNDYITSIPIIKNSVKQRVTLKTKETKYGVVEWVDAELDIEQQGYILFKVPSRGEIIRENIKIETKRYSKRLKGIRFIINYQKEVEHLLYNFLPLILAHPFDLIFTFRDLESVYIFPHEENFSPFVKKYLFENFESFISELFKFGYRAVLSCPCENGCNKCLYYVYHEETKGLNKTDFGKYLASFEGEKEEINFSNLMSFRKGEVKDKGKLNNLYNNIREKVLNILMKNLDIEIEVPVPLKVEDMEVLEKESGSSVIGLFNGDEVKVIPMKEIEVIQTITHEYIHNWQNELGIVGDKFLIEGAAQWLSTKVVNYYCRIDEIESKIMGTSREKTKEYFNGFQFLQKAEYTYGYNDILGFIRGWPRDLKEMMEEFKEYKLKNL